MIAVITGDIINSRKVESESWLPGLRVFLEKAVGDSSKWEIYRGDSFQIETDVEYALELSLTIKALIKNNPKIDVRLSVGIGEKSYSGSRVTESNGPAFINSGDGLELMKQYTLFIKTPDNTINDYFDSLMKLISFICDGWKPATADAIFCSLTNKELKQREIAQLMGKDSTTVSKALKRGAYNELCSVLELYSKITNRWKS